MKTLDLTGIWQLRALQDEEWMNTAVPGSVFYEYYKQGKMNDPFYRDEVLRTEHLARQDYEYKRSFMVQAELLAEEQVVLVCEGLDTIAEISVNGVHIASTQNMHRTYEFDVKPFLFAGVNSISILFRSALNYIEQRQQKRFVWSTTVGAVSGFNHLRKAHSSFGWDWGPVFPDLGIWRSIGIYGYSKVRLNDVLITQAHSDGQVDIRVAVTSMLLGSAPGCNGRIRLYDPEGQLMAEHNFVVTGQDEALFTVKSPALWWPNGYGEQPLYRVTVTLEDNGVIMESKELSIGLRTITWRREPDAWGTSFEAVVNGVPIFAKGANYIPEDIFLSRVTPERTKKLIMDCVAANFNMLRIWGGGYFPDDVLYDLCDQCGILIWQDLLFACAAYEMTELFTEEIVHETIDNVRRLRHHACLALWCGNNEMEWAWVEWDFPKTDSLREDYVNQFERILPEIVRAYDPQTCYWLASPSSGGGFDQPNDPSRGDVHYWDVWHGTRPFTDYRNYLFRFCSEFGFQSLPDLKTIESFTEPEDRNFLSYVMETHQNHPEANGKIMNYLAQMYLNPSSLELLIYASQLVQADAIKYGVDFWRQNRGICMGSIYWQLNDNWPVVSWSSIDIYGRWKALHYFAKRFYQPVYLSAREEGTSVELFLTNDTPEPVAGTVAWKLRRSNSEVIESGHIDTKAEPLSARSVVQLDFSSVMPDPGNKRETYLEYAFTVQDGTEICRSSVLFVRSKHFKFLEPCISWHVAETMDAFEVTLISKNYAKSVELSLSDTDLRFSDNYIDLSADEPRSVAAAKDSLSAPLKLEEFTKQIRVRSVYDIK